MTTIDAAPTDGSSAPGADPTSEPVTVHELLMRNAELAPGKTFMAWPGGECSNQTMLERARSVATGLYSLGVSPTDTVASWLPNGPEAVESFLGVTTAGAIQAPLNIAYRGRLLEHALNLCGPAVLIVHHELVERLAGLDLPHLRRLVVVGPDPQVDTGFELHAWSEVVGSPATPPPPEARRQPSDDMVTILTSGTTGPSKGVRCSYLHHVAYAEWFQVGDLGGHDRALVSLPMFHVGGTGWVYALLKWGGSIGIIPRFATDTFWDDVRQLGVTTGTVMGAMAKFLLGRPARETDRDNPLRIALLTPYFPGAEGFGERFGVQLWAGYAMSEVPGPIRTELPARDLRPAGKPTSDAWEVRLVDGYDMPVEVGATGELIVRHKVPWTITHGYVNMPEATANAWQNGWFHTGDMMREDDAGNLYFVDRGKDALRRRGENISSYEVEAEVLVHPDVVECAVVAVSSSDTEDEVMAFVVRAAGSKLAEADLLEFLIPRMPHYMVPRYIEFVGELPKTPTSKVRKVDLRAKGVSEKTWDREKAGIVVKSSPLSRVTDSGDSGSLGSRERAES